MIRKQELPVGLVLKQPNAWLNDSDILELHSLNDKATNIAKQFLEDLKVFSKTAFDSFIDNLLEESFTENITHVEEITKDAFKKTILNTIDRISSELGAELEKHEGVLFNGFLARASVQVLEAILEFEQTIDSIYPGGAKKIIHALGNNLIGLVSIYSPPVGILIRSSGVIDKVADFLACDNLTVTISNLKEKIHQVQQNKELQRIYQTGIQIAELSQIIDIPSMSLSNLYLKDKSLTKTIELCGKSDTDAKLLLTEAAEIAALMPKSKVAASKMIETFKDSLLAPLKEHNLPHSSKQLLEAKISTRIEPIDRAYSGLLSSNESFFARLACQIEVNHKLAECLEEFKCDLGIAADDKSLAARVAGIANRVMPALDSTKLLKYCAKSPIIAKELGFDVQTKILLEKKSRKELSVA